MSRYIFFVAAGHHFFSCRFYGAGFLIRLDCFDPVDMQELFDDRLSWNVAEPEAASFVEVKPLRRGPPPRPPVRFKNRVMSVMRAARPAL